MYHMYIFMHQISRFGVGNGAASLSLLCVCLRDYTHTHIAPLPVAPFVSDDVVVEGESNNQGAEEEGGVG